MDAIPAFVMRWYYHTLLSINNRTNIVKILILQHILYSRLEEKIDLCLSQKINLFIAMLWISSPFKTKPRYNQTLILQNQKPRNRVPLQTMIHPSFYVGWDNQRRLNWYLQVAAMKIVTIILFFENCLVHTFNYYFLFLYITESNKKEWRIVSLFVVPSQYWKLLTT